MSVIGASLSCSAAVLASGLFIVTASLAVTANGEAQFVLVYSEGLFGVRLCEDLMRSSRRARPSVRTEQSASKGRVNRNPWVVFKYRPRAKSIQRSQLEQSAQYTQSTLMCMYAHTRSCTHTQVSNTNISTVKTPQD